MSKIVISCIDRELEITESNVITSGGMNDVSVVFNFCYRWEGFIKTAVFYQDKEEVYHAILVSDSCTIPWEVMTKSGTLTISVFGTKNGATRTANEIKVKVKKGGNTAETAVRKPSEDIYSQLIDLLTVVAGNKGEKGDKGDTGNSGYSGNLDELELVNNLNDGGDTAALSAEMGKVLDRAMKTMSYAPIALTNNTSGYFLASGGMSLSASAGYITTDYIDVSQYSEVYVTAKTGQIYGTVAGYDADKNFTGWLLGRLATYNKEKVSIPEGVQYIRINSNSNIEVYYPEFESTFSVLGESIDKLGEELSSIMDDQYNTKYSSVDKGEMENGWLLADGTVKTYASTTSYFVTGFISVAEGETYYIDATKNASGITVGAFDENQTFMASLLALGAYEKKPVTIPTGCHYIRVSSQNVPTVSTVSYSPKVADVEQSIEKMREDIYTAYKPISYDEGELFGGFIAANGVDTTTYGGYCATPFIDVRNYPEVYVSTEVTKSGINAIFLYDEDRNFLSKLGLGTYEYEPIKGATYIRANGQGTIPRVYYKGVGTEATKKKIEKNVNYVGMSIWWYDGKTLASGAVGGGEIAKGYQTLLKERFEFLSDTGTDYCYSGNSLGATSKDDENCIMLKAGSWLPSENAIWTLDTITNDFKRNIPIGTTADYDNATGVMTYYGALRAFKDKVSELSGNAVVIASNALRRNNSGYTSTSKNSNGDTLESYEKALAYVCMKNGWEFVDQYRLCALSDNVLEFATLDGLHPNNLGFRMAVVPWYTMFSMIHDKLI
jgi:hypothetical protein